MLQSILDNKKTCEDEHKFGFEHRCTTISGNMLTGLDYWRKLDNSDTGMFIYGGAENYTRNGIRIRNGAAV